MYVYVFDQCLFLSDLMQHQMDPSSNFSNYRTALRGATQRSETAHSSQEKVGEHTGFF